MVHINNRDEGIVPLKVIFEPSKLGDQELIIANQQAFFNKETLVLNNNEIPVKIELIQLTLSEKFISLPEFYIPLILLARG